MVQGDNASLPSIPSVNCSSLGCDMITEQTVGMLVLTRFCCFMLLGKKPSSTAQAPPDHHGRMTTFKPVPAPPRDAAATTQSNHTRKDHPLILQDTNHTGLTVTANPLAFAMENAEM